MIIIRVAGGLGNQMQQYALYRKLRLLGKDVRLDLSWFDTEVQKNMLAPRVLELKRFDGLEMTQAQPADIRRLTGPGGIAGRALHRLGLTKVFQESEMYHPEIFEMEDRYLEGYFACNKYYADILPELRKAFRFPESRDGKIRERNEEALRSIEEEGTFSVAVHIRRGDYLDSANAGLLGGICTPQYYESAVRYLESLEGGTAGSRIRFFVFSDDPEFAAAQSFGTKNEPVTVCGWNTGEDSMLDMMLMSRCRGLIAANSTFSFWGGRLNGADDSVLIRPLRHRNNQIPEPAVMHSLWEGWVLIDTDGKVV